MPRRRSSRVARMARFAANAVVDGATGQVLNPQDVANQVQAQADQLASTASSAASQVQAALPGLNGWRIGRIVVFTAAAASSNTPGLIRLLALGLGLKEILDARAEAASAVPTGPLVPQMTVTFPTPSGPATVTTPAGG